MIFQTLSVLSVHGGLELLEDRHDLQGQDLPLRPADLHALELEVPRPVTILIEGGEIEAKSVLHTGF